MTPLTHIGINADDTDVSRSFYADTFGWHFAPWGPPGFYRVEADDPSGPGVMAALQQRRQLLPDGPTSGFECTVAVQDLDAVARHARSGGGRVLMERTTITGVGHLLWLADPAGNVVGAMQYDEAAQ